MNAFSQVLAKSNNGKTAVSDGEHRFCPLHCSTPCWWLAQVTPFWEDLFELQEFQVDIARGAALLGLGVVALAGARCSAQAYLHAALVQWWTHKHAGLTVDTGKAVKMGAFIKMRADFINLMYCKVRVSMNVRGGGMGIEREGE